MEQKVESGITIVATPFFLKMERVRGQYRNVFQYHIEITNTNAFPVQLLRRQWKIADGFLELSKVEGEGVIGEKPIISAGETYVYTSFCPLIYPVGKMEGKYLFQRLDNEQHFEAQVPTLFFNSDLNNN